MNQRCLQIYSSISVAPTYSLKQLVVIHLVGYWDLSPFLPLWCINVRAHKRECVNCILGINCVLGINFSLSIFVILLSAQLSESWTMVVTTASPRHYKINIHNKNCLVTKTLVWPFYPSSKLH